MAPLGHEHRHLGLQAAAMSIISGVAAISRFNLVMDDLAQPPHVVVVDVAAVLAQMHGDPVGTRPDALRRPPRSGSGLVGTALPDAASPRDRC